MSAEELAIDFSSGAQYFLTTMWFIVVVFLIGLFCNKLDSPIDAFLRLEQMYLSKENSTLVTALTKVAPLFPTGLFVFMIEEKQSLDH